MNFDDRVLTLFAEANPVADDAMLDDLMQPSLVLIDQGEGTMSGTNQRRINTDRPIVKQERGRGLIFVVATAVAALVLGTVTWIILATGEKTLEAAADGGDHIAVIEVFHQKWTEGDVDGALRYVAPSAELFAREALEFVIALEPAGWSWSVQDCAEQVPGTYQCRVTLLGDPVIDALAPGGRLVQFRVEDSWITQLGLANYQQEDQLVATYAQNQDPDGYSAVCTGPISASSSGFYNQECGAFLSQYLAEFAATLATP